MKKITLLTLLLFSVYCWGQQANDCIDAIVVCGNTEIESNVSGYGTQELDPDNSPCGSEEVNSLWLKLNIGTGGSLAFDILPNDSELNVDYDFYLYGPDFNCDNYNTPIRCSTTNPVEANLSYNSSGLDDNEIDPFQGPGSDGNSYVSSLNVLAGQTYYLLIDRPHGGGGFRLEWTGTARFEELPPINEPIDIMECANANVSSVDLTVNDNIKPAGNEFTIAYFPSLADAFDGTNVIIQPETYPTPFNETTVYTKITGPGGCFEIKNFKVAIDGNASIQRLAYAECATNPNGTAVFDLEVIWNDILDLNPAIGQSQTDFYASLENAENGTGILPYPIYETATTTLYAKHTREGVTCDSYYEVTLTVSSGPAIGDLKLVQCDVDSDSADGITEFNLEEIYNTEPALANLNVQFFVTEEDITINNAIADLAGYSNIGSPFSQTIFYKTNSGDCPSQGEIELVVEPTTVSEGPGGSYYLCEDDTLAENLTATLFVRIENSNECIDVKELELGVLEGPEFEFPEEFLLCTDGDDAIQVSGPEGFDTIEWFKQENGSWVSQGNEINLSINEIGEYRIEAGSSLSNEGDKPVCTAVRDFSVNPSSKATILNVYVEDLNGNTSLRVEVSLAIANSLPQMLMV